MKRHLVFLFVLLSVLFCNAQLLNPIKWSATLNMTSQTDGEVHLEASIAKGWHLYGMDLPKGGPNSTVFSFEWPRCVVPVGNVLPSTAPIEQYDPIFELTLSWWADRIDFVQKFKIEKTPEGKEVEAKVRYQGCDNENCIAPQTESFTLTIPVATTEAVDAEVNSAELSTAAGDDPEMSETVNPVVSTGAQVMTEQWWQPVKFEGDSQPTISETPWWHIFIWGFGGGLLALLTPCVWPLIPMTVSFFLKKSSSRRKAIGDALIYGVSIIVLYLALGLAITLLFGASKLNDLATNAVFNLLFFLLLVVFAISFFGAFDITLPSKWSNSVDSKAEKTTGLISIFFMAFTLALVSFSCTGPIIGTLLVEAASMGNITGPAIGMGAFALALAIPFTLFAVFPSWLKEMPRSGGWLNSVKVVLGFLELALSLKFLSVADLAYGWGILDREVFVALWIVLFALLGMYLLGKLRFSHDTPKDHVSIFSFFLALISFSFSVYLVPGLWGAPLKGVSAFVPPLYTQDFNLYSGGQFEEFDDYDAGMAYAASNHRPVLIDFSGYGCVNCRKMEGAVFDTQEVSEVIKQNFVLIKLMVDDKKALAEPVTVTENGRKVTLETVGDKWSYLQRMKFGANSQPYYVILDNLGQPLEQPAYYDENAAKFVYWLESGLKNYNSKRI